MIGAEGDDREAVSLLQAAIGELVSTSPWAAGDLALRFVELTPPKAPDRAATVAMAVPLLGWAVRTEEARVLGENFFESASVDVVTEAEILGGIRRAWLSHYTAPILSHSRAASSRIEVWPHRFAPTCSSSKPSNPCGATISTGPNPCSTKPPRSCKAPANSSTPSR
jgi:hypothetical protein